MKQYPDNWGWIARSFHWLMALAILGNFWLGWYADGLGRTPLSLKLFLWHKSIGITVLSLAALRLTWRLIHGRPALPFGMPAWQRWASHLSHTGLYLLMFATPLVGWLLNSAANIPLNYFGWFEIPSLIEPDRDLKEQLEWWHWALAWSMFWLFWIHLLAALKHHFINRDRVLLDMIGASDNHPREK